MQDCGNSIANALELLQSCTKSSISCTVCGHRANINGMVIVIISAGNGLSLDSAKMNVFSLFICNLCERSRVLPIEGPVLV